MRSAGKPNKTSRTRTATRGKSSRVAKVVRGGDLDAEKAVKQANCRRHSARPHRVERDLFWHLQNGTSWTPIRLAATRSCVGARIRSS